MRRDESDFSKLLDFSRERIVTKYLIAEPFIGGATLDIEKNRYDNLMQARLRILAIRDLEDSFEILARTFLDFEEFLLKATLTYFCAKSADSPIDFFDDTRANLNLRLTAILNSSRVYEEQVYRRFSTLVNTLAVKDLNAKPLFNKVYDASIEYRIIHALRNHASHHSLPIDLVSYGQKLQYPEVQVSEDVPKRFRYTLNPRLKINDLLSSGSFKSAIKPELESLQKRFIDVKYSVRGFVARVAECHVGVRELTAVIISDCAQVLENAQMDLEKVKGKSVKGLSLVVANPEKWGAVDFIGRELSEQLGKKRDNWRNLAGVQSGYVSSEVIEDKEVFTSLNSNIWIPE